MPVGRAVPRRLAEAVVLAVAAGYVTVSLAHSWPEVSVHLRGAAWPWLAAAFAAYAAYFAFRALAWRRIMAALGSDLAVRPAARVWLLAEFSRYLPGGIWSFLGRVHLAERAGAPRRITGISLAYEMLLMTGSAAAFALAFAFRLPAGSPPSLRWLALLALPALIMLAWPGLLGRLADRLLLIMKREALGVPVGRGELGMIAVTYLLGWLLYGLGSATTAAAFLGSDALTWWVLAAFVVSWLIGYLSVVTPMGLGVREAAIIAFLAPVVGAGLAGLAAVVTRIWFTVCELIVMAGFLAESRYGTPKATRS